MASFAEYMNEQKKKKKDENQTSKQSFADYMAEQQESKRKDSEKEDDIAPTTLSSVTSPVTEDE